MAGGRRHGRGRARPGIDCDLAFDGALIVALSEAQPDGLRRCAGGGRERSVAGAPSTLAAEEERVACGSPHAEGGILLTRAGSVQPALLVQGLRRLAVEPAFVSSRRAP